MRGPPPRASQDARRRPRRGRAGERPSFGSGDAHDGAAFPGHTRVPAGRLGYCHITASSIRGVTRESGRMPTPLNTRRALVDRGPEAGRRAVVLLEVRPGSALGFATNERPSSSGRTRQCAPASTLGVRRLPPVRPLPRPAAPSLAESIWRVRRPGASLRRFPRPPLRAPASRRPFDRLRTRAGRRASTRSCGST